MKIYISADIEGISGVVHPEQTLLSGKDYPMARQAMIREVNAAVEGAFAAGADVVVVGDAHSHQFNLLPEELDPRALLMSGNTKPVASMLEGLDGSFDGVFFIGYHGRAGVRNGVLNHTYFPKEAYRVRLNEVEVGEIGFNAALAGHYGVPVCLVTGDAAAVAEAEALIDGIAVVPVKEGFGKYCALCIHPTAAREKIRRAAETAVKRAAQCEPFVIPPPVALGIDFGDSAMADMATLIPGTERTADRSMRYVGDDVLSVYKVLRASLLLANAAHNPHY